jgi:hypothetical protein
VTNEEVWKDRLRDRRIGMGVRDGWMGEIVTRPREIGM